MKIPVTCERTLVGLPARPKVTPQREAMVTASNDGAFKLKELERAEAWIAEVASHVRLPVLDEHKFSESCKSQERKLAERATLALDVLEASRATGATEATINHLEATLAHLDPTAFQRANDVDEKDRANCTKTPQLSVGGSEEIQHSEVQFCDLRGEVDTNASQVQHVLDCDECLAVWARARGLVAPNATPRTQAVWKPVPTTVLEFAVTNAKASGQHAEALVAEKKKEKPPW